MKAQLPVLPPGCTLEWPSELVKLLTLCFPWNLSFNPPITQLRKLRQAEAE